MIAPIITSRQHRGGDRRRSTDPLAAVTLAEVLATSDLPGGVVNILTGDPAEIAPHLAAHGDVNALDLTGADGRAPAQPGAGRGRHRQAGLRAAGAPDFAAAPGTARLRAFLEIKTVWHPDGALSLSGGTSY